MSHDEPTPIHHHRTANPTLADTMHELSCELVALRQEMRGVRETVRELRDQVGDVVRFLPGPGGAVADLARQVLAPISHRQADTERDTHAQGFQSLVGLIQGLPNTATISNLKAQVASKVPSTVRDAIASQVACLARKTA